MRDAPSIPLITALQDMGAKVRAYDPVGMEQAKKVLPELTYCEDAYDCAKGADALVIVTEWEQFRALDLDRLKQVMAEKPAIVDLRNIYLPEEMRQRGFVYESVGRPAQGQLIPVVMPCESGASISAWVCSTPSFRSTKRCPA